MTATSSKTSRATQTTRNGSSQHGSSASNGMGKHDSNVLLKTLIAFKKGNFRVRMPVDLVGMDGKIADAINDILELNQRMVQEFDRISRTVGKEGKIAQRASIGSTSGEW